MPIADTEQERITTSAPHRSFGRITNDNKKEANKWRRPPVLRSDSRWSNLDADKGGNHGDDRVKGGNGGLGRFGGRSRTHRRNCRGYHGDMRRDGRLEKELFGSGNDERPKTEVNVENYDFIPVEASGRDVPHIIDAYTPKTVGRDLARNAKLCGYVQPTPVQKYSIPIGTAGRDLLACAHTGSGKTAGFLFPVIASMISKGGSPSPRSDHRSVVCPEALVLAPTRELASQINQEARRFTYCTGIASAVVYGGYEVRVEQLRRLFDRGGCDLLVATPGRLLDLIGRERISLEGIRYLVLDEADQMFDMGFEPQIRRIVEQSGMPSGEHRQTMMFSATFPNSIQRLASDFLRDYIFVTVGPVGSACRDVNQTVEYVHDRDKLAALIGYLLTVKGDGLILVFVETKRTCDHFEDVLCDRGFPACSVHGGKTQADREEALASFKGGGAPVMVATDVASRGLDIPNVTHVINVDFPRTIDSYVHRIGRTGRAGKTGDAVSFINEGNVAVVPELCHMLCENDQEVPEWLYHVSLHRVGRHETRRPASERHKCKDYRNAFTGDTKSNNLSSFVEEITVSSAGGKIGDAFGVTKNNIPPKTNPPRSIVADAVNLALPGEDETAAAARIARRKRNAEEKAAAEKEKAEEEAAAKEAAERKRVDDAARASAVESQMLEIFSSGGMKGATLAQWSASQIVLLPSVDKLVFHILSKDSKPDLECKWAEPSEFGAALLAIVCNDLSGQMEVLWGIQKYCHSLHYPKLGGENLVQAMFRAAYKYDLVDEDGFAAWKEDESQEHETGKTKAIIQTMEWFTWLEEDDDDDEEYEGEGEEEEGEHGEGGTLIM